MISPLAHTYLGAQGNGLAQEDVGNQLRGGGVRIIPKGLQKGEGADCQGQLACGRREGADNCIGSSRK